MAEQSPPSRPEGKDWYADHGRVVSRVAELAQLGFDGVSLNAMAVFQAGARPVDTMVDRLAELHEEITAAVGGD